MNAWEEHINRCMELYDSKYAELCRDTGLSDRLTLECDCYNDDELEGILNRNKAIASIFGEGREAFLSFVGRETDYYPDKIDDAMDNHIEAAVSSAEQYFIIEFVQNQLNYRLL